MSASWDLDTLADEVRGAAAILNCLGHDDDLETVHVNALVRLGQTIRDTATKLDAMVNVVLELERGAAATALEPVRVVASKRARKGGR
jgi:hypothetical protein